MTIRVDDLKPYGFRPIMFGCKTKGGWVRIRHSEALNIVWITSREHHRAPIEQFYNWRKQEFTDANELVHAMNQQGFKLPEEHPGG